MKHNYPTGAAALVKAYIDVNLQLENLNSEDTRVGAWLNVMGYIIESSKAATRGTPAARDQKSKDRGRVLVQAVMIWSAGSIKLKEYEDALQARLMLKEIILDA